MTDKDKIVRFPVNAEKRIENRRGKHSVSCKVTNRWLSFEETAQKVHFGDGEIGTAIFVYVMTDTGEKPRRICELCITLEDLQRVLGITRVVDAGRG